jgi:hypothetical protein
VATTLALKTVLPPANLAALLLESVPGAVAAFALFWLAFVEPAEKTRLNGIGQRTRRVAVVPPL